MPRYDYQCTSCDLQFELVQTFSEAGTGVCPVCSGNGRRVFHAVPVIYKGSGFYTTDYGRPKSPPAEGKESEGKEKTTESSGSSDSKSSSSDGDSSVATQSKSDSNAKTATESAS